MQKQNLTKMSKCYKTDKKICTKKSERLQFFRILYRSKETKLMVSKILQVHFEKKLVSRQQ